MAVSAQGRDDNVQQDNQTYAALNLTFLDITICSQKGNEEHKYMV